MPGKSWNLDIIDYMRLSFIENRMKIELKIDWKDGVAWDKVGMTQVSKGLC